MWKYDAINEQSTISLHDCRITHIDEQNGNISFSFMDGFWIVETNAQNPFQKTLRTEDGAKLTLTNANCVMVVMEKKIIRWHDFWQKINGGEWQFECIHENYTAGQVKYDGWIWFKEKPCHRNSSLKLNYDDAIYQWNEIREDRP